MDTKVQKQIRFPKARESCYLVDRSDVQTAILALDLYFPATPVAHLHAGGILFRRLAGVHLMPRTQIDLTPWQDFRGKDEGVLIHINTSREALMPVRDALDEFGKGRQTEPNYETGTFGLVGPSQVQLRNSLVKNKKRYIFFGTIYEGIVEAFRGKFLIVGLHAHRQDPRRQEDPPAQVGPPQRRSRRPPGPLLRDGQLLGALLRRHEVSSRWKTRLR
jgi:hypothetical protein